MSEIIDVIIDYETLGGQDWNRNESSVVELGAVCFPRSALHGKIPEYNELINNGFRAKFNLKNQKGIRRFNKETLDWWRSQSETAQRILKPSIIDVSVEEGHRKFLEYLVSQGVDRHSTIWCRGNDFDFPIMHNCFHQSGITDLSMFPKFWKRRDVRTRIEALVGDDVTNCPLPLGVLTGFVKHNGIHDCAKDIMMMCYAARYAFDLEQIPAKEDTDPSSIQS